MKLHFCRFLPLCLILLTFSLPSAAKAAPPPADTAVFMHAEQGDVEALGALRAAAERGTAQAQYEMGMLNATGRGLPQNNKEAYFWLCLAANGGQPDAPVARDEVKSHLFPSQALEVESRVADWRPLAVPPERSHH